LAKDLEKSYQVKILQKNKGFYVIDCENRWQFDYILLKL
jgi:hypothetical protein